MAEATSRPAPAVNAIAQSIKACPGAGGGGAPDGAVVTASGVATSGFLRACFGTCFATRNEEFSICRGEGDRMILSRSAAPRLTPGDTLPPAWQEPPYFLRSDSFRSVNNHLEASNMY